MPKREEDAFNETFNALTQTSMAALKPLREAPLNNDRYLATKALTLKPTIAVLRFWCNSRRL
jgi:hypothetical protein